MPVHSVSRGYWPCALAFRDLKSARFGLGFSQAQCAKKDRLGVLLLLACLAPFVLRLIGEVGKANQLDFQFQSNTRRSRPVLSVISLALQLVQNGMAAFPPRVFGVALERLHYDHSKPHHLSLLVEDKSTRKRSPQKLRFQLLEQLPMMVCHEKWLTMKRGITVQPDERHNYAEAIPYCQPYLRV
jgi:hypothetical protein